LVGFGTGFIIYLISYLAPDPIAECPDPDKPGFFKICCEPGACSLLKQGKEARVYFDIDSWSK
jgi:hypothetical protein